MEIKVKCERPKYASGEHKFSKFEELFHWLVSIKGLSKGAIGATLYGLAKSGYYRSATARDVINIDTDPLDYIVISDLGYKVGLLKTRDFGEYISKDRAVALQFARELDNLSKGKYG